MNEPTAADDVRAAQAGRDLHLPRRLRRGPGVVRDDVLFFAVPFQKLVEEAYPPDKTDKGYRDKLRKVVNMVYVGVVASVCGIEMEAVEAGIRREFPGRKAKAAEINIAAAAGRATTGPRRTCPTTCPTASSGWSRPQDKILIEGNKAAALGALFGGASVLTWYPITPSSSLAEYAEEFLKKHRVGPDGKRIVRRRPGRGRAGRHRHGHRRRLGRGPGADGDRRGRASR